MYIKNEFTCIGFIFPKDRPNFTYAEDYLDYRNRVWAASEAEYELANGLMPPGMLIRETSNSKIGIVVGFYNEPQEVMLLSDYEENGLKKKEKPYYIKKKEQREKEQRQKEKIS